MCVHVCVCVCESVCVCAEGVRVVNKKVDIHHLSVCIYVYVLGCAGMHMAVCACVNVVS